MCKLMMKRLLIAVILAGCSSAPQQESTSGVRLTIEPSSPEPGDSATLILENGSDAEIGYNLCPSALMRQAGAEWAPVPSDRMCTMELRLLQPAGTDRFTVRLPDDLEPGNYRFETPVNRTPDAAPEPVVTPPFEVGAR